MKRRPKPIAPSAPPGAPPGSPRATAKADAPPEPARLRVKLTPRASRDRLAGREGELLKVHLTSPPVDGQANRDLLKFLAKILQLAPSRLTLAQGAASRDKLILVSGLSPDQLWARLEPALAETAKSQATKRP
jgi:uncharacterized protein (TIGR00251 family)